MWLIVRNLIRGLKSKMLTKKIGQKLKFKLLRIKSSKDMLFKT